MKPASFFDRDGTLMHDPGYLGDPRQVVLLEGAAASIVQAQRAGYLTIVISNQSGVARGYFSSAAVDAVNARMQELLLSVSPEAILDAVYYCPHRDEDQCPCRKPRPGLFLTAAQEHAIDLAKSFAVGDSQRDVLAACAAGVPCERAQLLLPNSPTQTLAALTLRLSV